MLKIHVFILVCCRLIFLFVYNFRRFNVTRSSYLSCISSDLFFPLKFELFFFLLATDLIAPASHTL